MLRLIAWHTPRNECLNYVTRAVRVTDQILISMATNRQSVVDALVDRLAYEVDIVLSSSPNDIVATQLSCPSKANLIGKTEAFPIPVQTIQETQLGASNQQDIVENSLNEFGHIASSANDLSPSGAFNTQRSGLMKSILNLLKRLCLDTDWNDAIRNVMETENRLPSVMRRIFTNGHSHFTPHLALFAMETITNYIYTYPSRISFMQVIT
ncbi:unnamed protein product [Protopolystoma xenopodis]|uniref:Uncharacterized protein n=1 Tax=Protopolystoma xenopodis TaxID=117903 RepID=A0A3S5B8V1_9PLAT|nr:unnamed protein product [Protopolystoma xenopodis]